MPVATFSIVAFDSHTKDLGVAVQSRYFSVGSVVPWAQAGIGAVATQSFVNVSYGPKGLKLLKRGLTVNEVIAELTRKDKEMDYRQVGIIDAKGNAAAFTGKNCFEWAGAKVGKNFSVQGNILVSEKVVAQMAERFESAEGDLAERLVATLEGGEAAGGDARGRQSASLLVVRNRRGRAGYGDRYIDLRVEDHPDPIRELRRLLGLQRVYLLIDEGDEYVAKGNFRKALSTLEEALRLNARSDDALIDLGIVNMKLGNEAEAVGNFRQVLKLNPKMKHVLRQMPELTSGKGLKVLDKLGLRSEAC